MSFGEYLRLTWYQRWVTNQELNDLIDRVDSQAKEAMEGK